MRLSYSIFILCLVLTACLETNPTPGSYFDTKSFFEDQSLHLQQEHILVKKNMTFDGNTEVQQPDSINWKEELNPFISIDLLKPAYAKRLQQDSTRIDRQHYQLTYSSSDKKTDIKKVTILFEDNNSTPLFVRAVMAEKNTLYESEKVLSWYTDSAFVVEGHQKVNLSDQLNYRVEGLLIRP